LTVVHATPWSSHDVLAPDAPEEAVARVLDAAGTAAVGYGHIHVQYQRRPDGRLIAAVGTVGPPLAGDQRAGYGVVTSGVGGWPVEFRRGAYELNAAIEATLRSGVPNAEGVAAILRTARPANR